MERYQKALNKAYEIISDLDFSSQLECAEQFKILQEAVDKANKYDEKEAPKKPIIKNHGIFYHIFRAKCPSCNENIIWKDNRCLDCGQKLDWSDEVCHQK